MANFVHTVANNIVAHNTKEKKIPQSKIVIFLTPKYCKKILLDADIGLEELMQNGKFQIALLTQ